MSDERQGRDRHLDAPFAQLRFEPRARRRELRRDIAHGDRPRERGGKPAGCDASDGSPVRRIEFGARAHRRLSLDRQPDAKARRPAGDLRPDALASGKAAFGAPAPTDRPGETRLDGIGRFVDVLAIEAQPGLQPQRVARAEADRRDILLFEKTRRKCFRRCDGRGNFEAVFARIARAGDAKAGAVDIEGPPRHERHVGGAGQDRLENGGGARPLQGEQRAIGEDMQAERRTVRRNHREVVGLARGVDDEQQPLLAARNARDEKIVEDAAFGAQQQRIARPPRRKGKQIGAGQPLQLPRRAGAGKDRLPHVRNVEQPRFFARVQMLRDRAGGIVQRHVVAGEGRHARAEPPMKGVEGKSGEGGGKVHERLRTRERGAVADRSVSARPLCPLT